MPAPPGPAPGEPDPSAGPADEPVDLPLQDSLDLHTFHPRDIPAVVEAYIEACREAGLSEVRLIHGKGTGVQRKRVRHVLAGLPGVIEMREAPPGRGHWGATLVRLDPAAGPPADPAHRL